MKADMHIHSIFSDSSRSPEEIVTIAEKNNISLISICDHATIDAYCRLLRACEAKIIKCVLGVELSASWNKNSLHMLAYNFDKNNEQMKALINEQHKDIECEYIIYNMLEDFPQMSLEDFRKFNYPKEKGGWKYLYYAVAKGAAASYEEANNTIYARYATINHLSSFEECTLQEFCAIVKQANGVPVLAHPGYLYEQDIKRFAEVLKELKELGVGGIECYYPSHTKDFTNICLDFCKNNDMRITGGSDCHGDFDTSDGFTIGAIDISLDMLDLKGIL